MDIRVPKLADGFTGGTVVSIQVAEGRAVREGDVLVEMETEKAVGPIPSPVSGVVEKVHVRVGESVSLGQVLVSVRVEVGTPVPEAPPPLPSVPPPAAAPPSSNAQVRRLGPEAGLPHPASPSLRRTAVELGIDLGRVPGSGPGGRIEMSDLKAYLASLQAPTGAASAAASPAPPDPARWGPVVRKPLSTLRRSIAKGMVDSWTHIPQVTQFGEADGTRLADLLTRYAEEYEAQETRLTPTVFYLKALATLLKQHPLFNSVLDEATQEVVERGSIHVGLAVDTPQGLIVPVLRDVDTKGCLALCREMADLAQRTRERKVTLEDLQGGGMTLSNEGGVGGAHFTPIIRPGESAVLGVGRSREQAVVLEGKVVVQPRYPLSLTHDHRLIDGADAVRFLNDLVGLIEGFDEGWVRDSLREGKA